MYNLTLDGIIQKIKDNKAPFWILYFDIGGQRAHNPCDFNDSESDKTKSIEQKIKASCDKLKFIISNYKNQFDTGKKKFYITIKKDRKANTETSRFDYIFSINNNIKKDNIQDTENRGYPLGMLPKQYIDQKLENLKKEFEIDYKTKDLIRREQELSDKNKIIDKESTIVEKGLTKSLLKIYDALTGEKTSLVNIPDNTDKTNNEPADNRQEATERLATYIYENVKSEQEINKLFEAIKNLLVKKTQKEKEKK